MNAEERIQAASKFLIQSPPGEINDVLNGTRICPSSILRDTDDFSSDLLAIQRIVVFADVRNIISDDETLQAGILPALKEYNLAQFITAEVPGHQHQCIVSEAARAPKTPKAPKPPRPEPAEAEGEEEPAAEPEAEAEAEVGAEAVPEEEEVEVERFWDPRSRTSFRFDHLTLEASDPEPVEPWGESEPFRVALENASLAYLSGHFHDGVTSVFSTQNDPERFIVQLVANKYNPSNYWSGRWRSEYIVNLAQRKIEGKIFLNVHYYEQGNVQLSTTHTISLEIPPAITSTNASSSASKILALIEAEEARYQMGLNAAYQEMGDKTFKGLRRALPMTRAKLDWDRVRLLTLHTVY
ncbi:hypothetical protein EIP86_002434 [Pleurotus ostreatoroseus]|nr:hypothetical protein EIP86_002434 [Pleurotus ostreatoroseus]